MLKVASTVRSSSKKGDAAVVIVDLDVIEGLDGFVEGLDVVVVGLDVKLDDVDLNVGESF